MKKCPAFGEELFAWFVDTLQNVKGRLPAFLLLQVAELLAGAHFACAAQGGWLGAAPRRVGLAKSDIWLAAPLAMYLRRFLADCESPLQMQPLGLEEPIGCFLEQCVADSLLASRPRAKGRIGLRRLRPETLVVHSGGLREDVERQRRPQGSCEGALADDPGPLYGHDPVPVAVSAGGWQRDRRLVQGGGGRGQDPGDSASASWRAPSVPGEGLLQVGGCGRVLGVDPRSFQGG